MKKRFYLLFFLNNLIALADEQNIAIKTNWEPNYFGMFFGLFLVIGLIYVTAFVYQKLLKIKINENINSEKSINIISTMPLGQNKNLHIVKIKDDYILLGSTPNSITHIKDLEDYDEKDGYYN